jgi:hypothetical protein
MGEEKIAQFLIERDGSYYRIHCPRPSQSGYYLLNHADVKAIPKIAYVLATFGFTSSRELHRNGYLFRRRFDVVEPMMLTYRLAK